jgi:hypothetical protein
LVVVWRTPTQRAPPSLKFPFPQAFLDDEDNPKDYVLPVEMFIQIHAAKYTLNSKHVKGQCLYCEAPWDCHSKGE